MLEYKLDFYIIPSSDPHISEYVADHWKARAWISGFNGSAGTFVVSNTSSGLWTDGRYFLQAEKELYDTEIQLFKTGLPGVPSFSEWIEKNVNPGNCIGMPGKMIPVSLYKELEIRFAAKGIRLNLEHDLIEKIWLDRPDIPKTTIFEHTLQFTGRSIKEKIERVRLEMGAADYYLISSLDDIAWLYNIRGNDIPFVGVTICYALLSKTTAFLCIDPVKVPDTVRKMLTENQVQLIPYEEIYSKLSAIENTASIIYDPKRTNTWLYEAINKFCKKKEINEITTRLKAVKNETELMNIKECQTSDGVAMIKILIWLETNIDQQEITEIQVVNKLNHYRSEQENNLGQSFATIAAYQENGAMMHYTPDEKSETILENKGLMVLDSGGQYLNGTTDITRTIVFEKVTAEEIKDYTNVLKAHIALASTRFLYGSSGSTLDVLARKPLWDLGIDYKSGTGHGVGYCLSVHEGPHGFSLIPNHERLEKNMLITIEPGIYRDGKHGIRIENIYQIVEDEKNTFGQFMCFEPMTWCPIEKRGINPALLTHQEKNWLNQYHALVYEKLSDHLSGEEKEWLLEKTKPI